MMPHQAAMALNLPLGNRPPARSSFITAWICSLLPQRKRLGVMPLHEGDNVVDNILETLQRFVGIGNERLAFDALCLLLLIMELIEKPEHRRCRREGSLLLFVPPSFDLSPSFAIEAMHAELSKHSSKTGIPFEHVDVVDAFATGQIQQRLVS